MVELLKFIVGPALVALLPAAISVLRHRLGLAVWLALGALVLTFGAPFVVGMSGMDAARPHTLSVVLLASIALVWPLALLSFAVGSLIAIGPHEVKNDSHSGASRSDEPGT